MAKNIRSEKKSKAAKIAAMVAAAGGLAMTNDAHAADAQFVAASSINGVVSTKLLPNGSLEVVLDSGEVVILDQGDFTQQGGEFFFSADALDVSDSGNLVLIGLGVAAVAGGIAVLSSGGGDDDVVAPPPPPVADTNVATDGNDNLTGTAADDTISGLSGDDIIDGLAGNDTLSGNAGNDTLRGGDGDDILAGGGGTDIIEGGAGIDTNSFEGIGSGVTATVAADGTGTADYGNISESFTGIENLTGTDNDDVLTATGAAANTIFGGAGDDIIAGGGGTDILDGGEGNDTNSFVGIGADVTASLEDGTASYGMVNETFVNFENLTGSVGDDNLTGDANANVLDGAEGDDTLIGGGGADTLIGGEGDDVLVGGGGTDIIDGGDGIDTNSFAGIGAGVTANIADGTASYGMVNETFTNIENLTGSSNDDNLTGDDGDNILDGADGNDILVGGLGADILIGGLGDDILVTDGVDQLDGGEGNDTADFSALEQGVIVDLDVETAGANQTNGGVDGPSQNGAILDAPPAAGGQPVDGINLVDIENVVGTDFNDGLFGNNEVNTILAGEGDDLVHGFAGDDLLDGGEGTDTVLFSAAPDGVVVNLNDQVEDVTADDAGFAATGGAGNNVLSGFENVTGSQSDDTITGDENDNVLNGNGGDDVLTGGLGNDTLIGGEGVDTADFSDIDVPVTITVDAEGNGTAVRDTGFSVEVVDAVVDGSAFGAGLTPATFVSEALAGNIYFNIHTSEFGGGEIRGQLDTILSDETVDGVRTIVIEGDLDAAQEPNDASDSEATGTSVTTIVVAADGSVTYSTELEVTGLAPSELISLGAVSAIHLHNAPAGVNGPVVQDVIVDAGNPSGPALPFTVAEPVTETDTLESIEEFILSDDNDVFTATGAASQTIDGGDGDDIIAGGGGTDFLDGGAGIDTNSFEGIGFGVTATVNADGTGTADYGPVSETFVNFENLIGSANDDVLTATGAAANTIFGGAGDDIIAGGGGTDILDGGEGNDTNSFEGIGFGVTATLNADGTGTADYGPVSETFVNFENLIGSDNDDVLTATGAAANTIFGGAGDDIIAGGGGTDILDGGEGNDTNSFEGIGFGVTATLNADGTGTADYGPVSETFVNFENLIGSDNDDVLTATGAAANTIFGGAGDDIIAGGGGTDILDGGEGNDTNSFVGIGGDVTASLVDGTASYGQINETFVNFENLTGSVGDDNLTGDANANVLDGAEGNDTLSGGAGNDTLDGGDGFDTVTFLDVADNITVTDNGDGTFTASSALDGVNTLRNVENLLDSTGAVIDFDLTDSSSTPVSAVSLSTSPLFENLSVDDALIDETTSFEAEVEFASDSDVFEDEFVDFAAMPDMFEVA